MAANLQSDDLHGIRMTEEAFERLIGSKALIVMNSLMMSRTIQLAQPLSIALFPQI